MGSYVVLTSKLDVAGTTAPRIAAELLEGHVERRCIAVLRRSAFLNPVVVRLGPGSALVLSSRRWCAPAWGGWGAEGAQDVFQRGGEQLVRGLAGGLSA